MPADLGQHRPGGGELSHRSRTVSWPHLSGRQRAEKSPLPPHLYFNAFYLGGRGQYWKLFCGIHSIKQLDILLGAFRLLMLTLERDVATHHRRLIYVGLEVSDIIAAMNGLSGQFSSPSYRWNSGPFADCVSTQFPSQQMGC